MALVAWPTAGANSYVANANADTYFADAIHATAWTSATETTQNRALVTATRSLDRLQWAGTKTVSTQDLEWPRTGANDKDGAALSSSALPTAIKEATYELALALITGAADQTGQAGTVKSLQSKNVSVEFSGAAQNRPGARMGLPRAVYELIAALLASRQMGASGRGAAYGTKDSDGDAVVSTFADIDKHGRTGPL